MASSLNPPPATELAAIASRRWDAVVVGAGPAGAMAARELARAGRSVLLVDRRGFPRDKVCGACLGGAALETLAAAGLRDALESCGGVPLGRFRVACRGRDVEIGLPDGLAVSRRRLDAALAAEAVAAGAVFLSGVKASWSGEAGERSVALAGVGDAERRTPRCRAVVAADGVGGSFLGDRAVAARGSRIGAGATVDPPPAGYPRGTIHMAVGEDGYAGAVRLEGGELNLAAALDRGAVRRAGGPGPVVASLIASAGLPPVGGLENAAWQGTAELTRRARWLARGRVFVVGDAAGYVEPFTGEGMAWALAGARRLAELLAPALGESGEAPWPELGRRWTAQHRRTVGSRQWLCRALATGLRYPTLVAAALALLAARPRLAAPVVGRLGRRGAR